MDEGETTSSHEPAGPSSRFTGLHARTYEMELLISGAVVFGLLQLPPLVDHALLRLVEGLAGDLRIVVPMLLGYVVLGVWALIGAFVLHLVLRAYWIGLLGLESVFPAGIRWDRAQVGPHWLRQLRARIGTLGESVDSTDDLCSLVFSFAFLVVVMFLYSIALFATSLAVALVICNLFFAGERVAVTMWVVFLVLAGLQGLPIALDKRAGARLAPGGLAERLLERLLSFSSVLTPMRWVGPIQLTLTTNMSPARVATAMVVVSFVLGVGFVSVSFVRGGMIRLDSYTYYPGQLHEQGIDAQHYRDRRDTGAQSAPAPSIQSMVIAEPYLELVMRYAPRRHNALVAADCPGVEPLRSDGLSFGRGGELEASRVRAVARCVGSLFKTSLDGERLEDLRWDFTIEPGTDLPALTVFIAVDGLAPGRHELEVLVPSRKATPNDRDEVRHVIPFWR